MLKINADDAGLHQDIDSGIYECIKAGKIDSISIITNGANFTNLLTQIPSTIAINLHVCLVDGENALAEHKLITNKSNLFHHKYKLFLIILLHPIKTYKEISTEVEAQYSKLVSNNLMVVGLDSHQHVHFFPIINLICISLAKKHSLKIRSLKFAKPNARPVALILAILNSVLKILAKAKKVELRESFGFEYSGKLDKTALLIYHKKLARSEGEVLAHPGNCTKELQAKYKHWNYCWTREKEGILNYG